jgi:putative spermidine/putrescine transport system substrate-binding protein
MVKMVGRASAFLALMVGVITLCGGNASAEKITVVSWGGAVQKAQVETYFEPYMKATGDEVVVDTWNGDISKVRAMVDTGNVTWDLVSGDYAHAIAGCDEGFLEKVDYSKLGNLDDMKPGVNHPCGVADYGFSFLFAYDADKIKDGPKTIADVFDTKKYPGKRGFWKNPKLVIEQALMADGVAPDKVYDVLSSPGGLDRAFAKLDTIKSDIIWWQGNAQAVQLLADGEVTFTQAYSGHIYNAIKNDHRNFKMLWDGQVIQYNCWIIPKGANKAAAERILAYIMQPKVMADFNNKVAYGPTRASAIQYIDPAVRPYLPTTPENTTNALSTNENWWADHYEEVNEKFQNWLAK